MGYIPRRTKDSSRVLKNAFGTILRIGPRSAMLRLFLILVVFTPLVLASTPSYRLDVKIGDKLTTYSNGKVHIYYIQGVSPGQRSFIVYSMETESQYTMDKTYLQRYILKLERKQEKRLQTVYVSQ
jgi:hypothetical protein